MKIMLIWKEFDLKIFTSLNSVMQKTMIVSFQSLTMLYVLPCSYCHNHNSPPPPKTLGGGFNYFWGFKTLKNFESKKHFL